MKNPQKWGSEPIRPRRGVDWAFVLGWVVILGLSFGFWYWIIGSAIKAALAP